jgi:hypothetical protein
MSLYISYWEKMYIGSWNVFTSTSLTGVISLNLIILLIICEM